MAAVLSTEEEKKVKEFIEQVSQREGEKGPITWSTGIKFLMARKFDVQRAVSLYCNHQAVRKKEGILDIDPSEDTVKKELLTEKFTVLQGRDSSGAAIALFTAKLHRPLGSSHQATLQGLAFQLDAAIESLDTQRNGLVFVYDMSSSKYSNFDYDLSIKILNLLKGTFPARLKKVLIVTAPLWFKAPFRILRLFVREKLRDRVFVVNGSQIGEHIPAQSLPCELGGNMEHNHREWLIQCLHLAWSGHDLTTNNRITTYFENIDNLMSVSITSVSSLNTPSGDEAGFFSSDMDSDSSKGTVTEKQNGEYREKRKKLENVDNIICTNGDDIDTFKSDCQGNHISNKRGPETTPDEAPPPLLPRKKQKYPQEGKPEEESIHGPENGGFEIKELAEYTRIKGRRGLCKLYAQIKGTPPCGSFNVSKSRPNLPKNRYTDVLCYDDTRVELEELEDDPHSTYINANFVDGYKHKSQYISTQGPLPRTFADFWRMVWEQMVLLVVMTTRTVERGRVKCGQYWPGDVDEEDEYGDFVVINNGIEVMGDFQISHLVLINTKTEESRKITHFQFLSWPDYGVPHSAEAFLEFMMHVRKIQSERTQEMDPHWTGHPGGPPIVIHCSAGIGRTGTFVTMDIHTRRLADIKTVDIEKTVRRIRTQRAFSIQMPDQYVFCHLALLEHAQREGLLDNIDLEGFEDSSSDSN